jgi:hypothetical protein
MSAAAEVIRTANRLRANEGKAVVLEGLAVDVAGRACVHLDRSDAIVPVSGLDHWDPERLGSAVRARGVLSRHAPVNDPATGIASLALAEATVERLPLPDDGRVRTAPELRAAEGKAAEIEGMAYRSSNGPIVVIYGGLVYVRNLPDWDATTVTRNVVVRGVVRRGALPPDAPPAGGSWAIDGTESRVVP